VVRLEVLSNAQVSYVYLGIVPLSGVVAHLLKNQVKRNYLMINCVGIIATPFPPPTPLPSSTSSPPPVTLQFIIMWEYFSTNVINLYGALFITNVYMQVAAVSMWIDNILSDPLFTFKIANRRSTK